MASCSIPIVFKPVKIGDLHYVDCGVSRNLPAWLLRDCCDEVVGVNVSPHSDSDDDFQPTMTEVAMRTYHLLSKSNVHIDEPLCDKMVTVSMLSHYRVFDLSNIHSVYLSGYSAARQVFDEVRQSQK